MLYLIILFYIEWENLYEMMKIVLNSLIFESRLNS